MHYKGEVEFIIDIYITQSGEVLELQEKMPANCTHGRPDFKKIFDDIHTKSRGPKCDVATFMCGPQTLVDHITKLNLKYRFELHTETFYL